MTNQKKPWQVDVLERLPVGMSVDALPWPTNLTIVLVDPLGSLHDGEKVSISDLPPGTMELVRTLAADGKHVWKKVAGSPPQERNGPIFEIMPRHYVLDGATMRPGMEAGIYAHSDVAGGAHKLFAEAYKAADAMATADAMTVLSYFYFDGIEVNYNDARPKQVVFIVKLLDPDDDRMVFFGDCSLWEAIHAAAEFLRRNANRNLDTERAEIMSKKGLKGEWGKWE